MIFDERNSIKPHEYNVKHFWDAILHSFWIHTEYNYTSDIQDFKSTMSEQEISIAEKCMLAISTLEVKVKAFWGNIWNNIPKPEIANVWSIFWMNEVIHLEFYSHLLELLWLNEKFETVLKIPCIADRIEYINKCMEWDFINKLTFFTLFIENVSLFSQFLILMSMNKHKTYLKGMSNWIMASTKEENLHAEFWAFLINTINKEYWKSVKDEDIIEMCEQARIAEYWIVDWIFSNWEIEYIKKDTVKKYIDYRIYKGLKLIWLDIEKVELPEELEWFEAELLTTTHVDFFNKKNTSYSRKMQSVEADDLF